jgi:hypothetical protein
MLTLSEEKVMIHRAEIIGRIANDSGIDRVGVRLSCTIELDPTKFKSFVEPDVVLAMQKAQLDRDENETKKDILSLSIRRDFDICMYRFAQFGSGPAQKQASDEVKGRRTRASITTPEPSALVQASGDIVSQPKVRAVGGRVSVDFKVELRLCADDVAAASFMVGQENVSLTTSQAQVQIPFADAS